MFYERDLSCTCVHNIIAILFLEILDNLYHFRRRNSAIVFFFFFFLVSLFNGSRLFKPFALKRPILYTILAFLSALGLKKDILSFWKGSEGYWSKLFRRRVEHYGSQRRLLTC